MNRLLRTSLLAALLAALSTGAAAEDLMGVYRLAQQNDPQLRAAEAARRAAEEAIPQARSQLLPKVSLGVDTTHYSYDRPNSLANPNFSNSGYTLSLSQPLFNYEYLVQLRQADSRVAQAGTEYQAAVQDQMMRVADRYFAVLAAIDNLEFAQKEKTAIARQLEQARKRFEVGLIAITDVHVAQASYDLAVAAEITAENELATAREALAVVTGQFPEQVTPLGEKLALARPDPADPDKWTDTALHQNLQVTALQYAVETARQEIKRRNAGHYPTLDLTAGKSYNDVGGGVAAAGGVTTDAGSVGLQFSLPLYTGGLVSSRVREARDLYGQASEQLEEVRRAVRRQARDAFRGVGAAISSVEALKQALVSTKSALDATEAGFEVGTRTIVDVLSAQRDLYKARRDYSKAKYDYLLNTLRLKQAAGTLAMEDLEAVNRWLK